MADNIRFLVSSTNNNNLLAKATCLLEQGYALLFESDNFHAEEALSDLKKVSLFVDVKCRHPITNVEREHLQTASGKNHDEIQHLSPTFDRFTADLEPT